MIMKSTSLDIVSARTELPLHLNARQLFGCGVEVGVQRGLFSSHILSYWRGSHLISVDPWMEQAAYDDIANVGQNGQNSLYEETRRRLSRFGSRSSIWRTTSTEAATRIPDHSLDFVYLDARHDYASVLEDLEAWFDKVRPGGILAGHDYLDCRIAEGDFGVKSAVDEFFAKRGIQVFATTADAPWISWMVEIPLPEIAESDLAAVMPALLERRTSVTIGVPTRGGTRQVTLALDATQMSQRIMLDALASNRMYEPDTCALLTTVLREGDVFVDVGTHVGFFTSLAAALVGESGRVISFEPDRRNFSQLDDHLAMNCFANVTPICAAVGAAEATAELWLNADNDGGNALWDVGRHEFNERSRQDERRRVVPVTTLDRQLGEAKLTPKLIKIDAEGSELKVLEGARGLLERRVPYVVCEINRFGLEQMGGSESELRAFMRGFGYETNVIHPMTGAVITLENDQTVAGDDVFNLVFRHQSAPLIGAA